jgi:hypothetical protein
MRVSNETVLASTKHFTIRSVAQPSSSTPSTRAVSSCSLW